MEKVRRISKRLKAVRNIHTITRSMEMIAAGRLARWRRLKIQCAPAAACMERVLPSAIATADAAEHPLLNASDGPPLGLLALTSDRGLCGGYNHLVLREACRLVAGPPPVQTRLYVIGRRGAAMARVGFGASVDGAHVRLPSPHSAWPWFADRDMPERIDALTDELLEEFALGWIGSLQVVGAVIGEGGAVEPKVVTLMPVRPSEGVAPAEHQFIPGADEVLEALLPMVVRIRMMQCVADAALAVQTARLRGMGAATRNAEDMIRRLNQDINRARQGRITAEMAELAGGVEAMQ